MTNPELPKRIIVEGQQESAVADQPETELSRRTIDHIDQAAERLQTKLDRAQTERGLLGRALNFFKEKLLRRDSADQALHKQLAELQTLRSRVETDPAQAQATMDYVLKAHGAELLAASHSSSNEVERRAQLAYDDALTAGKPMEMDEAIRIAKRDSAAEEELMQNFFAAGDVMDTHGEAQDVAQQANTEQYTAKLAEVQATDALRKQTWETEQLIDNNTAEYNAKGEHNVRTWRERLNGELDLNDDFVQEYMVNNAKTVVRTVEELTAESRAVRDWFDAGTYRNFAMERDLATAPKANELYQKEIQRASKSTRAQTMAFELFMSGRMALDKFSKKLATIRKVLGPGLMIDYAAHAGAEHSLASDRIVDQLKHILPELRKYSGAQLDVFRVNDHDGQGLMMLTPERHIIYVNPDQLAKVGVYNEEVEKITHATPEEAAAFMFPISAQLPEIAANQSEPIDERLTGS